MGLIRTLLAISVVFAHSYGFIFVGGRLAVQMFYIISGFLISYILIEAKTYKDKRSFYTNRFLRLFPLYWTVATISLLSVLLIHLVFNVEIDLITAFKEIDWNGRVTLTLANIFLLGQDWILFTGVRDGVFQLVTNFQDSEVPVWHGLLVPQAWSLGVEISFYIIAPFILFRLRIILCLLIASIAIRIYLIAIGLGTLDPWTYRFFPTELTFFLLGALSQQYWMPYLISKNLLLKNFSIGVTIILFSYCCLYFILPFRTINTLILLFLFIIALPYLFDFQRHFKIDNKIGELSYPIYITHIWVIWIMGLLLKYFELININQFLLSLIIIFVTILCSMFLNYIVGNKIKNMRIQVKQNQL